MTNCKYEPGGTAANFGCRCDKSGKKCRLEPLNITTPANCQRLSCLRAISGSGAPDQEITITIDSGLKLGACTSSNGTFRACSSEPLCPGYHTIELCYTKAPECPCACIWVYINEPVILPAPIITAPEMGSVITNDRPLITGSAIPGSLITVTTQNCQCLSVFADAGGQWSVQFEFPFAQGEQIITASQQQSECSISEVAYSVFNVRSVIENVRQAIAAPVSAVQQGQITSAE